MRAFVVFFLIFSFFAPFGVIGAPVEDFPLFRGNLQRTGYLSDGPQPPLERIWTFATRHGRDRIEAFPAADDGLSSAVLAGRRVFVGGHDGYLYALDAGSGEKLWEFATRGRVVSTPAVAGGRVFFGSTDNFIYALNAADGTLIWKVESGVREFCRISYRGVRSSPVAANGQLFIGGCDGRIRALDTTTGRQLWLLDSQTEGSYASPALAEGTVYTGSDGLRNSALFAIDAVSGNVNWRKGLSHQLYATPAVAESVVYAHVRDDHVYALDAKNGAVIWKTPAPAPQHGSRVFTDLSKSSPALAPDHLLVGIGRALVAMDRKTGAILWRTETGGKVDSSPLVVGDTVYVGSDDGVFYAFALNDGQKLWQFATGGKISISPAAGEGLIIIGSNDGKLYAFTSQSRKE
jgi:outer membrane protein assembly factor BamB